MNNNIVANNIRNLRLSYNMSQKDFALIAGVSDKAVSTWANGIKVPRMGVIQKIADHFGIKKSDILEDFTAQPSTTPPAHAPNDISHLPKIEQNLISTFRLLDDKGQASVQEQADLQLIRCKAKG